MKTVVSCNSLLGRTFQIYLIAYLLVASVEARHKSAATSRGRLPRGQQPVSRRNQLVHLCGTYPYRYIYLGPCPENEEDLGQQYSDPECSLGGELTGQSCRADYECGLPPYQEDVECDQGVCCTLPPSQQIMYWETCDNGGYFMSAPCSTDIQCNRAANRRGRGRVQQPQICFRGECCTTGPNNVDYRPDEEDGYDSDEDDDDDDDQSPSPNYHSSEWNVDCTNQGHYLNHFCDRDATCNRVRGLYLASNEQVACIHGSCCVMPRRLPTGARSWLDVCPSGGKYLGAFCNEDRDCGADPTQGRICERQRYCCTDPDYTIADENNGPRNPRDNGLQEEDDVCDDPNDLPTQTVCSTDFNCAPYNDEYCGDGGYCCIPSIGGGGGLPPPIRPPFNICSNGGQRLAFLCRQDIDCNRDSPGYRTLVCLDGGLCCTMPGLDPPNNYIPQLDKEQGDEEQEVNPNGIEEGGNQQPISSYALCYNGQRSRVRCTSSDRCKSNQSCINGLCCTRTGDEWQNSCGGATAVSSCFADRTCQNQMFCAPSAFCCECPYGQAVSKCTEGCPPNYVCEVNGYCCPRCPGGQLPYGSCYNNQCADNHACQKGNICCPLQFNF